jgi:DNA-binding MarR family transcriptional regulator
MSRETGEGRGRAHHWGSPEWVAAQGEGRSRLEAELIDEVRGSQSATHQMDEAAGRAMGINATDGRCLDILDRRGRLSAGELAEAAGLTTGAVTAVVDRLAAKGYVSRVADPGDRRRVLVEVTEKQLEAAWRLYGPLGKMATAWLGERSDAELRLLIEFNRVSREINERRAAEIRAEL